MTILLGLFLIYGVPLILTIPFWYAIRRWVAILEGRDIMCSLIPKARDVAHTEILLRVRNHPN